ncbi:CD40 ligand [Microcaecilia unicolor]|uniref:CD40 ligand n=1 Tax=Microcaecilia unicolor TaxID=1415580 RepID=A0A6P7YRH4_9AMPH|nr:CD40 ligand [Microcaecilia unicolor]
MNEPYNQSSPRPANTPSPATMKTFMCFLTLFILAQIIGTTLFGLYLYMKIDKVKEEMSLHEDYLFLRRIQKCKKGEDTDKTLLSCKEVVNRFHELINEATKEVTARPNFEKLQENKEHRIAAHPVEQNSSQSKAENKELRIAAHLVGQKSSQSKAVLQWVEKGYSAMINRLAYKDGKLIIETPGLYYVYSQVTFCMDTTKTAQAPFFQTIYLSKPHGNDRILLRGVNTQSSPDCSLHSIHQGGVFDLQKGDMLYINVTDSSRMNYDTGSTFFGMVRL